MRLSRFFHLLAYCLLTAAGAAFLFVPSTIVNAVVRPPVLVMIWSVFLIVGGITSIFGAVMRYRNEAELGWWYIEIAGNTLASVSGLIYAYAIIDVAVRNGGAANWASALVILAVPALLAAWIFEFLWSMRENRRVVAEIAQEFER